MLATFLKNNSLIIYPRINTTNNNKGFLKFY
jgi:hypothetical protein